jgi:hypothetical protein
MNCSIEKPNLFIVGHPRSGTSSLHQYLNQHPEVFMTAIKEPNYFARDFRQDSDHFHRKKLYFPYRTESQYLRLYKNRKHEKIAGEASATNLCSKVSAQEIQRFNPDAKIIMIFREPVDFLHSYHSAARFALGEHLEHFETALAAEEKRRTGKNLTKRVIAPSWLFYSEFVKYADHLSRYLSCFNFNQIKIVIFDDFRKDTPKVYRDILAFLNVNPDFAPEFKIINPNKNVKRSFLKKYALDSPYFRKALRSSVSADVYAGMKNFYKTKMVTHQPRVPLSETFRLKLMKKFRSEVEKFSELTDKDLTKRWGYASI